MISPNMTVDDGQITHLICVRLKIVLYDFLGGGSGFPVFPPLFFRAVQPLHKLRDIPCAISTQNVRKHQKTPYDSKLVGPPFD